VTKQRKQFWYCIENYATLLFKSLKMQRWTFIAFFQILTV